MIEQSVKYCITFGDITEIKVIKMVISGETIGVKCNSDVFH